jgi:diguanylate cyclase (GGDEF)-like protein
MMDWDDDTKLANPDGTRAAPTRDRAYLIVLAGLSVGEMFKIEQESTIIGRGTQVDIQVLDDGISRRHAELIQRDGQILVRDLGSTNGTFCNGDRIAERVLQDGDKIQVGSTTILKFTFHDQLDETFQKQMYESALRDGLTRSFNKKYFLDRLESEFAYAVRHQTALSLVFFDIDHFKEVNDRHGHLGGDYVLSTLSNLVHQTSRQEDVFARYGGEEFAIICRGVDIAGAAKFAERIRRITKSHPFSYQGVVIEVTVSIGVAQVLPNSMRACEELIAAADEALYRAKGQGRNRVCASDRT